MPVLEYQMSVLFSVKLEFSFILFCCELTALTTSNINLVLNYYKIDCLTQKKIEKERLFYYRNLLRSIHWGSGAGLEQKL